MEAAAADAATQPAAGPGPGSSGGRPALPDPRRRSHLSPASWVDRFRAPADLVPAQMAQQFEELWALRPAELGSVRMFGKLTQTPRYQQSYGMPYEFSGQTLFGGPVPPQLQRYLDWANNESGYGNRFNELLVNWYVDGRHYIGPHADDERQLAGSEPIISISLGATRTFRIRHRGGSKAICKELEMPHGTVLVMGGLMQREFTHEVPKIAGKKGEGAGRRINITLRAFKADAPAGTAAAAGSTRALQAAGAGGGGAGGGDAEPAAKRQRM